MVCKGGMDFSVGEVVEIGVMLAGEGFAEGTWNQDARGEIRIPVDVKTVARGETESRGRSKQGNQGRLVGQTSSPGGTKGAWCRGWSSKMRAILQHALNEKIGRRLVIRIVS
jgi:hypothetical protein